MKHLLISIMALAVVFFSISCEGINNNPTTPDPSMPIVNFNKTSIVVSEGEPINNKFIEMSSTSDHDVFVHFSLGGTAICDSVDYCVLTLSPVTIPVGEESTTLSFSTISCDGHEGDETIIVTLTDAENAELGDVTTLKITICDDN